ncbi:MAG: 50S ribosomal protein L5, partial [Planctomycetota bacterium]|nr:50S ribosomal protein L5 [Planctomycetota bacterium]
MPRLNDYYKETVFPSLKEKFGYKNIHQIPGLEKIVVSMGVGSAVETKSRMDVAVKDLGKITGQKPAIKVARKSVANFRLRAGSPVGCMVTLRNERMYEFFD